MVKVKICGVNTTEAMKASKDAEFVGFVFYQKSFRFIKSIKKIKIVKLKINIDPCQLYSII